MIDSSFGPEAGDHPIRRTAAWRDAVSLLAGEARSGRPVGIFTDFDGDGTTSAAIMSLALSSAGEAPPRVYVNRVANGFGANAEGMAALSGCRTVVVLDSGTGTPRGNDAYRSLARGVQLLIADHHPPADVAGLPGGALIVNPHMSGLGDSFRNATLCYLLARDTMDALGTLDAAAEANLASMATAGGYTDCIQDGESELHDAMRAVQHDGTHMAFHRRDAYLANPGLWALLAENAARLGSDPGAEWLSDAELSSLTDTLGIGKWDSEAPDSSLPYRLLLGTDPGEVSGMASELAGDAAEMRDALASARRVAVAEAVALPNGIVACVLGTGDLPARYRGSAGRVAKAVLDSIGDPGSRPPVMALVDSGDGTHKMSWRGEQESDPSGVFRMDEFAAELLARRPDAFLGGGGHRYAGSMSVRTGSIAEALAELGGLPVSFPTPQA